MEKHCGILQRVGSLSGGELVSPVDRDGNAKYVGSFRVATEIDAIQIGGSTLKKPRCEDGLFQNLVPGRQACIYVFRYFRTPVLLGVKYDDGSKHLISKSYLRGSVLQFLAPLAMLYGFGGLVAGGILGSLILPGDYPAFLALAGGAGAGGWSWWNAYQMRKDFKEAVAD